MTAQMPLRFFAEPTLRNPRLIAAWGCIGEVGIEAVEYLRDKLDAEEFGEIEPYDFFEPSIEVEDGLVEEPQFPQSKLYYWRNADGDDLILLIGDREPPRRRYEYASLLLEVAQRFQVERIYTLCAFPSLVSHLAEPGVFAVVNDARLVGYLEQQRLTVIRQRKLTSLNALLLSVAKERALQGIYLLGEVPSYSTHRSNPKTCRAVLKALTALLDVDLNMAEFSEWIEQAEEEMDEMVKEASRTFLEDFTIDYRDLFPGEEH